MYIERGGSKAERSKEKKPIRAITQIWRGVVKTRSELPASIVLLFPARIYRRHKPKPQGKKDDEQMKKFISNRKAERERERQSRGNRERVRKLNAKKVSTWLHFNQAKSKMNHNSKKTLMYYDFPTFSPSPLSSEVWLDWRRGTEERGGARMKCQCLWGLCHLTLSDGKGKVKLPLNCKEVTIKCSSCNSSTTFPFLLHYNLLQKLRWMMSNELEKMNSCGCK